MADKQDGTRRGKIRSYQRWVETKGRDPMAEMVVAMVGGFVGLAVVLVVVGTLVEWWR